MDKHSSSHDHQFTIDEELNVAAPRNALPYRPLLDLIRALTENHDTSSIPSEGTSGTWRYKFQFTPYIWHDYWTLEWELILQQMVFKLLQNHGVMSNKAFNDIQTKAEMEAEPIRKTAAHLLGSGENWKKPISYLEGWESGAHNFLQTIDQNIKPLLKEFCLGIVNRILQGDSSSSSSMGYDISEFIHVILLKLKDFGMSKPDLLAPIKKQMQTLKELLYLACIIGWKAKNHEKDSQNFLVNFQPWVNIAAALVTVYWVDEKDEGLLALVSSSLGNFNLSIPELVEVYILVIKILKPSNVSEILLMREIVGRFTEIVLQNLNVSAGDRFEMFREGLALCVALFMNPPEANTEDEKSICGEINLLVDKAESLVPSLCLKKMTQDISEESDNLLSNFLEMIFIAKAEVNKLHLEIPRFSWKNVLETSRRGHFDFVLGNLQKKLEAEAGLFPFEKHLIAIVHRELSLLRHSLRDIFELQDEHKELRDLFVQASNIAYLVDYITDFCLSSTDMPIWSNLMHLSNAIENIQSIKTQVSKIRQNDQVYNDRVIGAKLNSQIVLPGRQEAYDATTKDDFKVGFIEEEQRIIDCLVAGEAGRDIVAVVGMAGQGKTYLSQRTFQDTCIKDHFNKLSWCCISQTYDIKRVLVDILNNVGDTVPPELCQRLTQEDLADRLRKCLKGQRYLVVLDDMWDAKVWCDLQLSFPDDNKGSRILLTSRNRNVALKVKANCSIVELHPLSRDESWSLLSMKVFHGDCCPPTLSDIGKTIAENCKGLPLAVVVVAGILKKDKNVESWKQISKSLKPLIASEGCMDIVELSYKHLPDYLKPCFLYLGAFREDQIIDARKLIEFWIAEGFVQSDGMKTREVVAREYLMDLVSKNLVFVAERSSKNGIKSCLVHDLLHQLCLIKAEEERFLLVPDMSNYSSTQNSYHFRISVHDNEWGPFLNSEPLIPGLRSLLISSKSLYRPGVLKEFKLTVCNNEWGPFLNSKPLIPGLRSILFSGKSHYRPGFLEESKLIRVLDLNDVIVDETRFHELTQLIHLRLLEITCFDISIPPSIVNLLRLEVLRFYGTSQVTLPSAVFKMASLRHIFAWDCCIQLTEDFDKMVPDLSSPLTNLETINRIRFNDKSSFQRVAQSLSNILKFSFLCPICFRLSSYFKKLESLTVNFNCYVEQWNIISPSKLDFPLTLKKLNLIARSSRLSGVVISSIGKLSNLEVLKLVAEYEDDRWDVEDDEFLQLKYLELRSSFIQEWSTSEESFPCLEQLIVRGCKKLGELPARFGSITTLRRIEVSYCSESLSNSYQQIVDDQMDAGNEGLQYSISDVN